MRRSGKLPLTQYDTYAAACKQLGQRRCSDEDVMEWDGQAQPLSDYQSLIGQIVRCRDPQQRSFLIERLANLLYSLVPATEKNLSHIIINPEEPKNMEPTSLKVPLKRKRL